MIYQNIYGRCGNQFFQYAYAKKISMMNDNMPIAMNFDNVHKWKKRNNDSSFDDALQDFCVDEYTVFSGEPDVPLGIVQRLIKRLCKISLAVNRRISIKIICIFLQKIACYYGMFYESDIKIMPQRVKSKNIYINGYFEDPRFFEDISDILLQQYIPKHDIPEKNIQLYDIINSNESVCVSFRKWHDVPEEYRDEREVCGKQYYERAFQIMKEQVDNPYFVIFSDDIEWVKAHFNFPEKVIFEDGTDPVWEKIRLMSSCKHFIITNSTFAWWAQYLCCNKSKIVISPDEWFNGDQKKTSLINSSWITIEREGVVSQAKI